MSFDQQQPSPIDTLVSGLGGELETLIRHFGEQVAEQAARERDAASEAARGEAAEKLRTLETDVDRRIAEAVEAARAEAEESRSAFQAEADQRLAEAVATARAEAATVAAEDAVAERVAAAVAVATNAQEERFAAALDQARAEAREAAGAEVAAQAARVGERESALVSLERLLRGIESLDRATSLREALGALADAVGAEAQRTMVFLVRGWTLTAWDVRGFGEAAPAPSAVKLPLYDAGVLAVVVERAEAMPVHPDAFGRDSAAVLGFARLPYSEVGLAAPIVLGGRTVAVVYADDGDALGKAVPGGWPEAVQVLARHASRCLEVLTATHAAGVPAARPPAPPVAVPDPASEARYRVSSEPREEREADPGDASLFAAGPDTAESARRYARLLISELKLYNEATIRVGRHKRDLRSRLQSEIDRARRMYDERIPVAFTARDDVFEEELIRTLADGDAEVLGAQPAERS